MLLAVVEPRRRAPRAARRRGSRPASARSGTRCAGTSRGRRRSRASATPPAESPPRGWPTEPGFSSQREREQVDLVALVGEPAGEGVAVVGDRERDVAVADHDQRRASPCRGSPARRPRSARSPRPGRPGCRGRARRRSGSRPAMSGARKLSDSSVRTVCVQRAAAAASPLKSASGSAPMIARSWLPARQKRRRALDDLAAAGSAPARSRRRRRGTRSRRAPRRSPR